MRSFPGVTADIPDEKGTQLAHGRLMRSKAGLEAILSTRYRPRSGRQGRGREVDMNHEASQLGFTKYTVP